jgi:arsenite-transporting ATPase
VPEPRIILYVGKGGVGKTTIAAATAISVAARGRRTLVVSTDSAHSLGDVLGANVGPLPHPVSASLEAQEINVLDEVRRSWGDVHGQLAAVLRREGVSEIQADELAILPGIEEMSALVSIARSVRSGDYDCIVVDSAPTGEAIRLMSMPEIYDWYAARVRDWQQRLSRISGPFLRGLIPNLGVAEVAERVTRRVKELRSVLVDNTRSSFRIVLTPDRVVVKEGLRAAAYLSVFNYPVDAVVVNRLLNQSADGHAFLESLAQRQNGVVDEIRRAFAPLPIFTATWRLEEPVGSAALEVVADELFGPRDPSDVLHVGPSQRVERTEVGYVLKIPMPRIEMTNLSLRKRGDALYVDLGTYRREVALPRALAALEPRKARYRDGTLEIPFAPAEQH